MGPLGAAKASSFVELDVAKAASGVRMVVIGTVPSPWSEAAKGLFQLADIPVLLVRNLGDVAAISAWTGSNTAPVVMHDAEPARTSWASIVALVARLAPGTLVPEGPATRADLMGALEIVAGEDGLGYSMRLWMIDEGLSSSGERGFPVRVAGYLAPRYGHAEEHAAKVKARLAAQLEYLRARLGESEYFGGTKPNALDVYVATFLTMVTPPSDEACPRFAASLRPAFASAARELGPLVPAALFALRTRMFEQYLAYPIEL